MKKMILVLVCSLGLASLSFAQYGHDDNHYGDSRERLVRSHELAGREYQVRIINRDIDLKILAVQHDWSLRRHQKKIAIRALENERRRELMRVREQDRHGDRDGFRDRDYR